MQVILKKEIQNLGEAGDIVNVKDGYARNFLLPQGAAEVATTGALENREKNIARIKAKQEKLHQEALEKAAAILKGKKVAIWGLAFKPETDDMREATALVMIQKLIEAGCKVKVYDPIAINECKRRIGNTVEYAADMYDAVLNADALLLLTEWKQFRMPSWGVVKKTMNQAVLIDGRNIYDEQDMKEIGFDYMCIGK